MKLFLLNVHNIVFKVITVKKTELFKIQLNELKIRFLMVFDLAVVRIIEGKNK
jgi:hypothetical protein